MTTKLYQKYCSVVTA